MMQMCKIYSLVISFGVFIGALLFLYYPVLSITHAFSDDYRLWWRKETGDPTFPGNIIVQGRWIFAIWMDAMLSLVHEMRDLVYFRITSIVGLTVFLTLLYLFLVSRLAFSALHSGLLCMLYIATPSLGILPAWVATFQVPYALIAVMFASLIATKSSASILSGIMVIIFLLTACWLYQTSVMLFPVLMLFYAIETERLKPAIKQALMFGVAMIGFLVIQHHITDYMVSQNSGYAMAAGRSSFTTEPLAKLSWFAAFVMPIALKGPFFLTDWPREICMIFASILIIAGVLLQTKRVRFYYIAALPLVCLLAYLPSIVVAFKGWDFRVQHVLSFVLVYYIALLCRVPEKGWLKRINVIILALCLSVMLMAQYRNLVLFTAVNQWEYEQGAKLFTEFEHEESEPLTISIAEHKPHLGAYPSSYEQLEYGGARTLTQPWAIKGYVYYHGKKHAPHIAWDQIELERISEGDAAIIQLDSLYRD